MQDDDKQDESSVWTSYSDLFTTVAVIFLVMFVFALIKAGISRMETVVEKRAHEAELRGEITKKNKNQTDQKVAKVNESLEQMKKYENLVNQKMLEMNRFVKKLQSNRVLMKDLLKDQQRKETQLALVASKINKVEDDLKVSKLENKKLNQDAIKRQKQMKSLDLKKIQVEQALAKLDEKLKKKQDLLKQEITKKLNTQKQLVKTEQTVEKEKQEKKQRDFRIDSLEKTIVQVKKQSIQKSAVLEKKIEQRKKIEVELKKKITQKNNNIRILDKMVKNLEDSIVSKERTITTQERKVASTTKKVKKQSIKLKDLTMETTQRNQQIEEVSKVVKALEHKLMKQEVNNKDLVSKNKNLQKQQTMVNAKFVSESQYLKEAMKNLQSTKSKLSSTSKQLASSKKNIRNTKSKNQDLFKSLTQSQGKIKVLQQSNANSQSDLAKAMASAKSQLGAANGKANSDLAKAQGKIDGLNSSNGKLSKKATQLGLLKQKLQGQLAGMTKENSKLRFDNGRLGKSNSNLNQANKDLHSSFNKSEDSSKKLKVQCEKSERANDLLISENKKLKLGMGSARRKIASVKAENNSLKSDNVAFAKNKNFDLKKCENQKTKLNNKDDNLKDSLNNFAKKVTSVKGKLRSNIASDLARAFQKANLNVQVDNKTGNVVLLMDKNFRFKKNSYSLNTSAKKTLKEIVPIYAKVLFNNSHIKDKISSFNVVGHASPSYKGEYVTPLSNGGAYSYNMRLSAQRASSITNYVFSSSIGDYKYKQNLKKYTRAIGQSFTKPIKKVAIRSIASKQDTACGPYNCHASQRVELSFTLKDDIESLNQLINMAKDIK